VDDVVHDVNFPSGSTVAVDAYLDVYKWQVVAWQRNSVGATLQVPELAAWLLGRGVPILVEPGTHRDGRVVTANFAFDAPPEDVAAHVAAVVAAIARSAVAPGEPLPADSIT